MKKLAVILVCVLISTPVLAEMYQWVDKHGVRHFSNTPALITGEDVKVHNEIEPGASQPQPQQTDGRQPSDSKNKNTDSHQQALQTAEIEKAAKRVEELTQSTELAADNFNRESGQKNKLSLYREYVHEQEKLKKAQDELKRLKNSFK